MLGSDGAVEACTIVTKVRRGDDSEETIGRKRRPVCGAVWCDTDSLPLSLPLSLSLGNNLDMESGKGEGEQSSGEEKRVRDRPE